MLGAACVCGGVVRRGRWEIEVEERLEIVEHMQFWELRSRTLHEYQFMIAVSLDTGQCVDPNWCGRYSVSAFMGGGMHCAWSSSLMCHLARQWPEASGSCSASLMNG